MPVEKTINIFQCAYKIGGLGEADNNLGGSWVGEYVLCSFSFFFSGMQVKIIYQEKHCLAVPPYAVWINLMTVCLLTLSGK